MSTIDTTAPSSRGSSRAETVREIFTAINAHDVEGVIARDHPDIDADFLVLDRLKGTDAVRAFFEEMLAAVPDLTMEIEAIHTDGGDVVTVQWEMTGTFSGEPFQGVIATGRALRLRGVDVMEFDGDLLRRNTIYYDGLLFARQVGLLPAEDTGTDRAMMAGFNALTRLKRVITRS